MKWNLYLGIHLQENGSTFDQKNDQVGAVV